MLAGLSMTRRAPATVFALPPQPSALRRAVDGFELGIGGRVNDELQPVHPDPSVWGITQEFSRVDAKLNSI